MGIDKLDTRIGFKPKEEAGGDNVWNKFGLAKPVEEEKLLEEVFMAAFRRSLAINAGQKSGPRFPLTTFLSELIGWARTGKYDTESKIFEEVFSELSEEEKIALSEVFGQLSNLIGDLCDAIDNGIDYRRKRARETSEEDEEVKTYWAQMNQKGAALLYFASHLDKNDPRRRSVKLFFEIVETIGSVKDMPFAEEFYNFVVGARAQASLMKMLKEAGYYIIFLDWDNEEEILKFDVKGGTDFVAIHPDGIIFLVDAKARSKDEESRESLHVAKIDEVPFNTQRHGPIKDIVLKYLENSAKESRYSEVIRNAHGFGRVNPIVITLPSTQYISFDGLGIIIEQSIAKQVTNNLAIIAYTKRNKI
ncbi:MAG: hypothetical protein KatS3mg090_0406 [Patescibacteria group bacterium]|nr:MAG: hypothetical protein KatS3mg090_0406 [Patescibacteria group bacterium]